MEKTDKLEEFLMANLSDAKMDKAMLKKLSTSITQLRKQDIVIERIWKYGIPAPDGIVVRGRIPLKDFGKLSKIFDVPSLWKVEVFPLGIPFPEELHCNMRIGEQIEPPRHGFL